MRRMKVLHKTSVNLYNNEKTKASDYGHLKLFESLILAQDERWRRA